MKPEHMTAGALLVHEQLTRPDQSDPMSDLVAALQEVPAEERGEIVLAAAIYGLAMSRGLLRSLTANGIDTAEALARHGDTLTLNEMYHQPTSEEDTPDGD